MDEKELSNFINEYMEDDDFTGGIDESQIEIVQNKLDVVLPKSYKWFLINYGSGGLFGVDILGVAKSNIASVVIETERFRALGLDRKLVVIENAGEYAYCLDTDKMEQNECPVIAWDRQTGIDEANEADNFYKFLSQRLLDAKEAWEEDF
ncbi:SMI1/KNR4 family protein [Fictibacillus enclensis]|uniref:SMI1/KNR4 family protein n=1 Tax=Fictibacillus enclensis TaxID=1017270 RepID=UPI0025A30CDE|nr:SMI1/KNR4 family protein [Fictibacillus enclensis]MDM5201100.1 SMI1/KNR4 family protein [Fictibacillus enclensis]